MNTVHITFSAVDGDTLPLRAFAAAVDTYSFVGQALAGLLPGWDGDDTVSLLETANAAAEREADGSRFAPTMLTWSRDDDTFRVSFASGGSRAGTVTLRAVAAHEPVGVASLIEWELSCSREDAHYLDEFAGFAEAATYRLRAAGAVIDAERATEGAAPASTFGADEVED